MENHNYRNYFGLIRDHTQTPSQAFFLEKLVYMYKITKYHFDDVKYFTRTRDQFAAEVGLSARTISNHLAFFEKKGLIERKSKLIGAKKRLYIRLSDNFCKLLGLEPSLAEKTVYNEALQSRAVTSQQTLEQETNSPGSLFLNQLCPTDMANDARTYNEINNNINQKPNSTVSEPGIVNYSKKAPKNPSSDQEASPVEKVIGERITERLKNYIKGTLKNLQEQHKLQFSEPDKLFAEVVFSVLNTEEQLVGIENPHHRVNIIAKLLKERRWSTPKGFYNHWDVGQLFKKKQAKRDESIVSHKRSEGALPLVEEGRARHVHAKAHYETHCHHAKMQSHSKVRESDQLKGKINQLKGDICSEERYLAQLQQQQAKGRGRVEDSFVESVAVKIARMYEKVTSLQDSLQSLFIGGEPSVC